jgi:hypothetical protein
MFARLRDALGIELTVAALFDDPTIAQLASRIEQASGGGQGGEPEQSYDCEEAKQTLQGICRKLARLGKLKEMEIFAAAAATLRNTFDGVAELDRGAQVLQLSHGDHAPHIICFPALAPVQGVWQYVRLSNYFQRMSDLSVVIVPGFQPDEPLASSLEALLDVLAEATLRCAQGHPFALLGHSTGGLLAHAVATHLEANGVQPMSVVLLDTFMHDHLSPKLFKAMLDEEPSAHRSELVNLTDSGFTAMGTYLKMFRGWQPQHVVASTLVVRPKEGRRWRMHWPLKHVETEVPGDHVTMVVEYADATAESVHDWLSTLPVPAPRPHEGKR